MTDRHLRMMMKAYPNEWFGARAIRELLAYRRAARRLKRAYGRFGPPTVGGGVERAVLDLLAVGVRR